MAALAGFWAGVAVAILGLAILLVLAFTMYQSGEHIPLSSIVYEVSSGILPALLALLFGPAIGALGGFIGKIYTEDSVPQSSASPPPVTSAQPPLSPSIQPAQSSATQQDQA